MARSYAYVGPADLTSLISPYGIGHACLSHADIAAWMDGRTEAESAEPFTFVIDLSGCLRLAPRRSEHVVCAGGENVLGAGEIRFERRRRAGWAVAGVSNQSTGYCPDAGSWAAVAAALDRIGLARPDRFTPRWCSADARSARSSTSCGTDSSCARSARAISRRSGTSTREFREAGDPGSPDQGTSTIEHFESDAAGLAPDRPSSSRHAGH